MNLSKMILTALLVIFIFPVQKVEALPTTPLHAGFIANVSDDAIWNKISINRQDAETEGSDYLYDGDVIHNVDIRNLSKEKLIVGTLSIILNPGYDLKIMPSENKIEIILKDVNQAGLCEEIWDYFNLGRHYVLSICNASKGDEIINFKPLPGDYVSVLSSYPVKITPIKDNNRSPAAIIFTDQEQKEVYRKNIRGLNEIPLNIREMGLEPGKQYLWKFDTVDYNFHLAVLDTEAEDKITADLRKLAQKGIDQNRSAHDRILAEAAYLQLFSDLHSGKADLYWLSYQILDQIDDNEIKNEAVFKTVQYFKHRAVSHISGKMR